MTKKAKEPTLAGGIVSFICLLIMALLGYQLYEDRDIPSRVEAREQAAKESAQEKGKLEAWAYCQQLVKDSLKAPSTASFPWRMNVQASGDVYVVDSYVDAQNSFGAMIRTRYFCQLQYAGADAWKVKDFRIQQ